MDIAIIGGGISGVAAARVLKRFGHEVVIFERSATPGGVWAVAYPEVRLQNVAEHYRLSDFPWPFPPDLHPTREQILRYLGEVVRHFAIDLRTLHEVLALREVEGGWEMEVKGPDGVATRRFDYVVVAAGQYTGEKHRLPLADRERFPGQVLTDRDVQDLGVLADKRVAVVGFGKSAVDMAAFAAERGSKVNHVFRTPRWLLPRRFFGVHVANVLFSRMSTAFIPSWVQANDPERFLHARLRPVVGGFWSMIQTIVRAQTGVHGLHLDPEVRRRMKVLEPEATLPYEMRSATALAPDAYYPNVIEGNIEPHRGEPKGFTERGLLLADGTEIPADLIILSTGFGSPRFPYLPEKYRALLEGEHDGPQLYRHVVHPRIPRLAFAGYNHGFLHVPGVEIAVLWLAAVLRGDLVLPAPEEMERRIADIVRWKRENVLYEPSRGAAVSTRFHQYLDVMLGDLGLSPHRKSNPLAELVAPYSAGDYAGVLDEYQRSRAASPSPRTPLPLST
jgi:cation diffusion facilitator CzcD-associated flavoprotein CzcO